MLLPIEHLFRYIFDNIVITFQAAKVNCVAVRVCPWSAEGVNTAMRAKPVARLIFAKLIKRKILFAL